MKKLSHVLQDTTLENVLKEIVKEKGQNYIVDKYQHQLVEMYERAKELHPNDTDLGAYLCARKDVNGYRFYIKHKETGNTYELVYELWENLVSLEMEPETLELLTYDEIVFIFLKHIFHDGKSPEKTAANRKGILNGAWITKHKGMDIEVIWIKSQENKRRMLTMAKENKDVESVFDAEKKEYIFQSA